MGGAWEWLIRSVKESLHAVLNEHAPKEETLLTIFAEIAHSINSRPLTHVPIDPSNSEALTPNHFLIGFSSGVIRFDKYELQTSCIRKQWQLAQHFANAFWKRWLREYLSSLLPTKKGSSLKVGNIVLLIDDLSPRNTWKKGVITRTFPGTDNVIRVLEVKTSNGFLKRPCRKIIKFTEVQNTWGLSGWSNVAFNRVIIIILHWIDCNKYLLILFKFGAFALFEF